MLAPGPKESDADDKRYGGVFAKTFDRYRRHYLVHHLLLVREYIFRPETSPVFEYEIYLLATLPQNVKCGGLPFHI